MTHSPARENSIQSVKISQRYNVSTDVNSSLGYNHSNIRGVNDSGHSSNPRQLEDRLDDLLREKIYAERSYKIQMKIIKHFGADYWLVVTLAMLEKMIIQPFIQNSGEMFEIKFNLDKQDTSTVIALPFFVFVVVGLLLGLAVDKKG